MSQVKIAPMEGKLVTEYDNNSEFGYIVLQQSKSSFANGWLREIKLSTIMKGSVEALKGFVQANPSLVLPGQLVVKEFRESEVPADIAASSFNKNLSYEEQIAGYVKTAGNDGPALMKDGERILRFTIYDTSSTESDKTVSHDNVDEIKAFNATAAESADINLPS